MGKRPDGSKPTLMGWVLILVGGVVAIVSTGAHTDALANGGLFGLGAIALGVFLVSLGYLVKAIWFLPGREIDS